MIYKFLRLCTDVWSRFTWVRMYLFCYWLILTCAPFKNISYKWRVFLIGTARIKMSNRDDPNYLLQVGKKGVSHNGRYLRRRAWLITLKEAIYILPFYISHLLMRFSLFVRLFSDISLRHVHGLNSLHFTSKYVNEAFSDQKHIYFAINLNQQ